MSGSNNFGCPKIFIFKISKNVDIGPRQSRVHSNHCYYCALPKNKLQIDHVTPVLRGGSNNFDNLVLACSNCNASKHSKDVEAFWRAVRRKNTPERFKEIRKHAVLVNKLKREYLKSRRVAIIGGNPLQQV